MNKNSINHRFLRKSTYFWLQSEGFWSRFFINMNTCLFTIGKINNSHLFGYWLFNFCVAVSNSFWRFWVIYNFTSRSRHDLINKPCDLYALRSFRWRGTVFWHHSLVYAGEEQPWENFTHLKLKNKTNRYVCGVTCLTYFFTQFLFLRHSIFLFQLNARWNIPDKMFSTLDHYDGVHS
jgi:hypothetical protein